MERAALGLSPGLRTPPTKSRTTHARVGTGHRARTWNYTLNSFVDLQSGSSLVMCDLGSHVAITLARIPVAPMPKAIVSTVQQIRAAARGDGEPTARWSVPASDP
jgi:hypothetical protein